jgi:amidase
LAAREHDFLTGVFSYRALQARGMRLSAPDFIGIQAWRARLRQEWARFFDHIDVALCAPAPTGPIQHDQKPDPHARSIGVNGKQKPHFDLMLWACLATGAGLPAAVVPATVGADGFAARRPNHRRTAMACAAMLEALGASFKAPPMASP